MKAEDLYRAIGEVDAEFLEHSEKKVSRGGRAVVRVGLLAAIVAALSLTAMAIPAVWNHIFGVQVEQKQIAAVMVDENSETIVNGYADVTLDMTLPQTAPLQVETVYVPLYPAENWEPIVELRDDEAAEDDPTATYFGWDTQDGSYVIFRQLARRGYRGDYPVFAVNLGFHAAYSVGTRTLDGCEVQTITVEPSGMEQDGYAARDGGRKLLIWSDGAYIFSMEVNYDMDEELLQKVFQSIAPVERAEDYRRVEYTPSAQRAEP